MRRERILDIIRKYVDRDHITKAVSAAAVLCAVWGWWGILYPQLTMTPETYRIVSQDGVVQEERSMDDTIYEEILNADRDRIRFKSKLFTELSEYLKRLQSDR